MCKSSVCKIALLCLIVIGLDLFLFSYTLEDAYITFRYSKHFAQGYGIGAWNVQGNPVEGFTPFLWMLFLGMLYKLGIPIVFAAKLLGIAAHVGIVLALYHIPRFIKEDAVDFSLKEASRLAAICAAFSLPLMFYASSGMETTVFAFVAFMCFLLTMRSLGKISPVLLIFLLTVVLLRPEGLYVALAVQTFSLVVCRRRKVKTGPAIIGLSLVVATMTLLTVYRMVTFGYLLPNTYYAKATGGLGHFFLGIQYMRTYVLNCLYPIGIIATVCVALISRKFRKRPIVPVEVFLWVFLGVYFCYVIKVGGDNKWAFPYWRHMASIAPFILVTFVFGVVRLFTATIALERVMLVGLALLFFNLNILWEGGVINETVKKRFSGEDAFLTVADPEPSEYVQWVIDHFGADALIATSMAGAFPYYVDAHFIDSLGLNDTHIAHNGTYQLGAVDTKSDIPYVLGREPDIIESTIHATHVLYNLPLRRGVSYWRLMEEEMIRTPAFYNNYLFIVNAPYHCLDRALFIRKDYYAQLPTKKKIGVVPVIKTNLYKQFQSQQ